MPAQIGTAPALRELLFWAIGFARDKLQSAPITDEALVEGLGVQPRVRSAQSRTHTDPLAVTSAPILWGVREHWELGRLRQGAQPSLHTTISLPCLVVTSVCPSLLNLARQLSLAKPLE